MKTTVKLLMKGLIVCSLVLTSCTKEGPVGPAGQNGTDGINGTDGQDGEALGVPGPQGDTGATGSAGTDGQDGNTSIIASDWFEAAWTLPADEGSYDAAVPALTQEILDHGVIMVYMKAIFDTVWALPMAPYNFFAYEGHLNIQFSADAPLNSTPQFRYILIPTSNTSGKSSSDSKSQLLAELKANGVDINDYYAVMDHFEMDY